MSLDLFYLCYAGVMGGIVGSFLNVVALRTPARLAWQWRHDALDFLADDKSQQQEGALGHGRDASPDDLAFQDQAKAALARHQATVCPPGFVVESSRCPGCGHRIRWWHNLPLVGWLSLRGRCKDCGMRISPRYVIVEALMAGLAVVSIAVAGPTAAGLALAVFAAWLLALSLIDFKTMLLPDHLVLPGLWLALGWSVLAHTYWPGQAVSPTQALIGAILGYGVLWVIGNGYAKLRGRQGMGGGDLKLLALIGAFLGPWALLPTVAIASVCGVVAGLVLQMRHGEANKPFPFGPWLAVGALAAAFGQRVCSAWPFPTGLS